MFILYLLSFTCKRTYKDQNHDFSFNNTKVIRRKAT